MAPRCCQTCLRYDTHACSGCSTSPPSFRRPPPASDLPSATTRKTAVDCRRTDKALVCRARTTAVPVPTHLPLRSGLSPPPPQPRCIRAGIWTPLLVAAHPGDAEPSAAGVEAAAGLEKQVPRVKRHQWQSLSMVPAAGCGLLVAPAVARPLRHWWHRSAPLLASSSAASGGGRHWTVRRLYSRQS